MIVASRAATGGGAAAIPAWPARSRAARPRVAVVQRILPEFRYELFRRLSGDAALDLRVFYGAGRASGSSRNTARDCSAFASLLPTIVLTRSTHRVLHPDLFPRLAAWDPDVVITEPSTYFPNNVSAALYAASHGKRLIWWEVGLANDRSRLRRSIEPILRRIVRRADACLAYSSRARRYLEQRYRVPGERIFVAQNTIANDYAPSAEARREAARRLDLRPDSPIVGYIGSLERRKRLEQLFDAAAAAAASGARPSIVVVGDGPDAARYRERARALAGVEVRFTGRLAPAEANPLLDLCDVTALPREGGLAINHSLSCGTPVICGENDGTEEDLITPGFNGLLLRGDFVTGLSEALAALAAGRLRFDRAGIHADYHRRFGLTRMIDAVRSAVGCALGAAAPGAARG